MKNLLIFLALLAAACTGAPLPSAVVEQQPLSQPTPDEGSYTKVFLAGTIDMGNSVDWQKQTIDRFRKQHEGRYLFFNPRRSGNFDNTPENLDYQVRWELNHLERADLIVMNLLGTSKSPISLLEMGIYIRSGKLRVACQPDYYRYDNVRITCEKYGVPLYDSLDNLLRECFGLEPVQESVAF